MLKTKLVQLKRKNMLLFVLAVIGGLITTTLLTAGILYIFWPGPDTLVVNDTSRSFSLNNCGDAASSLPPGDVWELRPGDQVYIPSGRFQKGNVCNVQYDDVQHDENTNPSPDACLPLPVHGGGTVWVSQGTKPYPTNSNDLCDAYIKF